MNNIIRKIITWLCMAALTAGCMLSGPAFKPVEPLPAGLGVIYIYRLPWFTSEIKSAPASANGKPLPHINSGGYFPYLSKPGVVTFDGGPDSGDKIAIEVIPGKEKYLKVSVNIWGLLDLEDVAAEIGRQEISECKLAQ